MKNRYMKDPLNEFIKRNRDAFDDKTPDENVWKKIEAHLPQMKVVSLWNSVALWRVAAVLFMGLSVMLLLNEQKKPVEDKQAYQLQGEFRDLENFYSGEIAKKVALIDDFGGSFEGEEFTQDFEKLDAMYQVLRDELKVRPTEKVRDALILNILVRIDLLNQQIQKLEDTREQRKADTSV